MLQKKDKRIKIAQSELSTSFARKKGIELAEGEYITFCDCDDIYINNESFTRMMEIAEHTGSDIVQFGHYINRLGKLTRHVPSEELTIDRTQLLDSYISGAIGAYKGKINGYVWNKVYRSMILKSAAEKMDEALIKTEDAYLNTCAFFEESVQSVSFSPECFYVYYTGFGYSGASDAGEKLFEEYGIFKPIVLNLARQNHCGKTVFIKCYREILNFLHVLIEQYIISGQRKEQVISIIQEYTSWDFVKEAASFFLNDDQKWDDHILRLSQIADAEAYYNMCLNDIGNLRRRRIQYKVKHTIKNTLRWIDRL